AARAERSAAVEPVRLRHKAARSRRERMVVTRKCVSGKALGAGSAFICSNSHYRWLAPFRSAVVHSGRVARPDAECGRVWRMGLEDPISESSVVVRPETLATPFLTSG